MTQKAKARARARRDAERDAEKRQRAELERNRRLGIEPVEETSAAEPARASITPARVVRGGATAAAGAGAGAGTTTRIRPGAGGVRATGNARGTRPTAGVATGVGARRRSAEPMPRRRRGPLARIATPLGWAITAGVLAVLIVGGYLIANAGGGNRAAAAPTATPLIATAPAVVPHGTPTATVPAPKGGGAGPLAGAVVAQQPASCHGYKTYGVPNVAALDPKKTYSAVFDTNKGAFTAKLYAGQAPIAVQSFVFLAQRHYFDNVPFHRVLPGFVIQGGDPTGTGGCGPGYKFSDENLGKPYLRGTLAMANAGPNTNGSQFFVVLKDNPGLGPLYTPFGQVTSGLGAIDAIAAVPLGQSPSGENSSPKVKVYMKSVRIVES